MIHFSKIKFSFFFLLLGVLAYPIHPPVKADITEAACIAQDGQCKEVCGESDNTSPGLCSDLVNSGKYCCIAPTKTSTSATGLIINTNICQDNGGSCDSSCWGVTGQQKVGVCRTGGDCCARNDAIAQKIRTSNIESTIQDPALREKALIAVGAKSTTSSSNPSFNYTLLEKIPGVDGTNLNLAAYLSAVYKLAIWIVGLCALFMFLIGAFMYMLSAANTSKMGSAKEIMQDALIGLVLALTSYLILYVINPDLVNLKLPTVSMPSTSSTPSGSTPASVTPPAGTYSHSEAVQALSSKGISTSSSGNCSDQNNKNCTSLDGIPKSTIEDVIRLKEGTGCSITVTGGTEVGHKSHGTGLPVVDLSENTCLEQYFSQNKPVGYDVTKICADGTSQAASYNCGSYVEAQAHFHIQFNT